MLERTVIHGWWGEKARIVTKRGKSSSLVYLSLTLESLPFIIITDYFKEAIRECRQHTDIQTFTQILLFNKLNEKPVQYYIDKYLTCTILTVDVLADSIAFTISFNSI